MTTQYEERLALLQRPENKSVLKGIGRGIERETLRINPDGKLSQRSHPSGLGSALTNKYITTDYSESLLEFITPVSYDIDKTLAQLNDVHKYTVDQIGQEQLWPLSMPCFIGNEDEIQIAQYGSSNIGKMKTVYRQGLKNRYGSMMQAIAGVHFNLSMPDSVWTSFQSHDGSSLSQQDYISENYLGLIRNFKRNVWLISYLFGASPALCSSFLQDKESSFEFETLGRGTLYMPYATSLRMSDLGYTNSAQSALSVSYNTLPDYIEGLKAAINTPSSEYSSIGVKQNDDYKQLNSNVLQIENEFYSPIRPKQNAESGETPTDALQKRGIEYIEVRTLDINPFSPIGINKEQILFLDVFLTYCLLEDSPKLFNDEQERHQGNLDKVILEGRNPELQLESSAGSTLLSSVANDLFSKFAEIAKLLDIAYDTSDYSNCIQDLQSWVSNPDKTYSGRLMQSLIKGNVDNGCNALALAETYKNAFETHEYTEFTLADFEQERHASIANQIDIEQADNISFDEFLSNYFKA